LEDKCVNYYVSRIIKKFGLKDVESLCSQGSIFLSMPHVQFSIIKPKTYKILECVKIK